jgi:hypothetical protein
VTRGSAVVVELVELGLDPQDVIDVVYADPSHREQSGITHHGELIGVAETPAGLTA